MAKELTAEQQAARAEKARIENEKKQLKKEQKDQRKEAKRRAKEIAKQEAELDTDEEGNGFTTFIATIFIVLLWLAVICVIVKLDIGGFGSSVLTPVLKDVPVLNKILPGVSLTETSNPAGYGGYSSLQEAVDYIKELEMDLERLQVESGSKDTELESLRAEVNRLREFESAQVEFQRIQQEFYEEVVYAEKGPGAEEYRKWYEEMNPATAESLYRQVVIQLEESAEFQTYAQTFSEMKPKEAAGVLEQMTDNMDLAARIMRALNPEDRAKIMNQMDAAFAARLAKIMDPET